MKIASLSTAQKIIAAAIFVVTIIAIVMLEQGPSFSVANNVIQAPEFKDGKHNSSEPTSISRTNQLSTSATNMAMPTKDDKGTL